jgi:hypothetical protein
MDSYTSPMQHHAFVIEAEQDEGIEIAERWVKKELGMSHKANPDVAVLRYGLFSPDDARRVAEIAAQAPFVGEHKVLIIAATRAYHEAQNALLKLFEEPPHETYLFFVLPSLGGLLPTLRSRVQILKHEATSNTHRELPDSAREFIRGTREKRSALIKKLTSGKDDEDRRELRDEAIAIVNGIEALAYRKRSTSSKHQEFTLLLKETSAFRSYLHDRSAPVKLILEHLSLVVPRELGTDS